METEKERKKLNWKPEWLKKQLTSLMRLYLPLVFMIKTIQNKNLLLFCCNPSFPQSQVIFMCEKIFKKFFINKTVYGSCRTFGIQKTKLKGKHSSVNWEESCTFTKIYALYFGKSQTSTVFKFIWKKLVHLIVWETLKNSTDVWWLMQRKIEGHKDVDGINVEQNVFKPSQWSRTIDLKTIHILLIQST